MQLDRPDRAQANRAFAATTGRPLGALQRRVGAVCLRGLARSAPAAAHGQQLCAVARAPLGRAARRRHAPDDGLCHAGGAAHGPDAGFLARILARGPQRRAHGTDFRARRARRSLAISGPAQRRNAGPNPHSGALARTAGQPQRNLAPMAKPGGQCTQISGAGPGAAN